MVRGYQLIMKAIHLSGIVLFVSVARGAVAQSHTPRLPETPHLPPNPVLAPAPALPPNPQLSPAPGSVSSPTPRVRLRHRVSGKRRERHAPFRRGFDDDVFYEVVTPNGALPPANVSTTPMTLNEQTQQAEPTSSAQPATYVIPTYQIPTYSIPTYP
jgi:hypothetical protein